MLDAIHNIRDTTELIDSDTTAFQTNNFQLK
jgi:hypothetical protein